MRPVAGVDAIRKSPWTAPRFLFGEPDIEPSEGAGRANAREGARHRRLRSVHRRDPRARHHRNRCWFIDTDYNEENFFVRHAYFLGANGPHQPLTTALKEEINEDAWASLYSATSRPLPGPSTGRIAVKVINHFGDEVLKVLGV